VYLVGAGPGDPGLLTVRGAELLRRAEVLVYDYLASPRILNLAPESCRRVYVGKMSGNHAKSQDEINAILIEEARAGRVVVRLKGGDPYIFGRGGEEAQELRQAGVPFEVTPGISSTVAAAAYAGIPLTHRDFSSQAALVTGHERPDKGESAHDWKALARMGTLSMVMGVRNLDHICKKLIEAGRAADTPAALVQWGTTSRQRTLTATLADLPQKAEEAQIGPPALFVTGGVVSLRGQLNWFETRPLFGRRVLVTRSREQASRLAEILGELGAEVWERPTIAIEPLADHSGLRRAFETLADYRWLVFTIPNGATLFLRNLFDSGRDARALAGLKIAVVGPGTAEALKAFGLKADLVPEKYVAESLLAALTGQGVEGQGIILPRAQDGRDVLPQGLAAAGATVLDVPVYRTVHPHWAEPLPGVPDAVTFTSSSTAAGLAEILPMEERQKFRAVSIGPITTKTAVELGFQVVAEAERATVDSLAEAVVRTLNAVRA
jgi:uroporphyrinogen III methyltransferase/synthase